MHAKRIRADITLPAVVFAACLLPGPKDVNAQESDEAIAYTVSFKPKSDRVDALVDVTLSGDWGEKVVVLPPQNCFSGGPEMFLYLSDVILLSRGSVAEVGARTADHRIVLAPETYPFTFRYRLSLDPKDMKDSFSPYTSKDAFFAAGCQWMAQVDSPEEKRKFSVKIADKPDGWLAISTWGEGGSLATETTNYDYAGFSAIGVGDAQSVTTATIDGSNFSALVPTGFEFDGASMQADLQKIVRYQWKKFGKKDLPFYSVALMPRSPYIAGTSLGNLFFGYARPDADRAAITQLISHEMFHNYFPIRAEITHPDNPTDIRNRWFHEGVTEYVARAILEELQIVDRSWIVDQLNWDFRNLADSRYGAMTYEQRASALEDGFGQEMMKTEYYRGALIAAGWDAMLRHKGQSVIDFAAAVVEAADEDGELTQERLFDLGREWGLDIEGDYADHVVTGLTPDVPNDWAGEGYGLESEIVPSYNIGFDLSASRRAGRLVGVNPEGPAYGAGLRDGMVLVRTSNTSRFSNSWDKDAPVGVTVRADGQERLIEYFPKGSSRSVPQFIIL